MRKIVAVMLFFGAVYSTAQQTILTPVPPKPACTPIFQSSQCAQWWREYNAAYAQRQREEIQLYVNRQKDLASAAATAPLQQQIADLNKLSGDQQAQLKKQQEQMQADATAALEAKSAAHQEGLWRGIEIGAGGMVLLFALIFGIRRLARNFTVVKKSQAKA